MSYILDALRRAEAERGRGAVPGIHTQAMPTSGMPAERPSSGNVLVIGTAVVAIAALAAGGTWWAMQRPAATPAGSASVVVAPPATPVPTPGPGPMPPQTVAAPAPAPAPAVATVAATPAPAIDQPLVPSTAQLRPVAPKRVAEPVREKPARESEAVRRETVAAAPPAAAPPAALPNSPVFAQNELPPSVREQLPVLQVTGATYSSNPAHRMAIVNGQVLQEGDQAAPGLKLERIEQGRTVWSFRGYRYAVAPQ